jgi:membrane protease YdiL (CAAX protease family)
MKLDSLGTKKRIFLFVVLVFALSTPFYVLISSCGRIMGGFGLYITGLMWCPAGAALLTCYFTRQSPGRLGWSWGGAKWRWMAYLIPLAYLSVGYGVIWIFGWGWFGNRGFIASLTREFGWGGVPSYVVVCCYILLNSAFGMAGSVASALGEEIGWRGFLAPEATHAFGFTKGAIFTGIIWASWHMPMLLFSDYNAGTPRWFALPCFYLLIIGISVPLAWLRIRSGSLWTSAIFHASHNLFLQSVFNQLTAERGKITLYAMDESGFVLPIVVMCVAILFVRQRGRLSEAPLANARDTDEAVLTMPEGGLGTADSGAHKEPAEAAC